MTRESRSAARIALRPASLGILHDTPRLDEDWERFATEDLLLPVWQRDRESLMQRLDRAEAVYRRLIEEAAAPP